MGEYEPVGCGTRPTGRGCAEGGDRVGAEGPLPSPLAASTTGAILRVDGGMTSLRV